MMSPLECIDPNATQALEKHLPELDQALKDYTTEELETPDGIALSTFKITGGPRLMVPMANGGLGLSALEAIRVQRGIAAHSPSMAVGSTMHHFSVASLVQATSAGNSSHNILLDAIASENLLVASGFAEGLPGGSVVQPGVTLTRNEQRYLLNGVKKPCSLSRSMDLITVSAIEVDDSGHETLVVIAIDANATGIETIPFWSSPILAAAESHSVQFIDVVAGENQMVRVGSPGTAATDAVQRAGFAWFTLLMSASYLGIAGVMVNLAVNSAHQTSYRRVRLANNYWKYVRSIESLACELDSASSIPSDGYVARLLAARVDLELELQYLAADAASMIGGRALANGSPSLNIYHPALQCLAFHPPRAADCVEAIIATLINGQPLEIR